MAMELPGRRRSPAAPFSDVPTTSSMSDQHTAKKSRSSGKPASAKPGGQQVSSLSSAAARAAAAQERSRGSIDNSEEELLRNITQERRNRFLAVLKQNWGLLPLFFAVWFGGGFLMLLQDNYSPFSDGLSGLGNFMTRDYLTLLLILGLFLLAFTYALVMLRFLRSGDYKQKILVALLLFMTLGGFSLSDYLATHFQVEHIGARLSALPIALLPALVANLFDKRFATITAVFQALLLPLMTDIDPNQYKLFYFGLFIAILAIPCFQNVDRRMQFLTSGLALGIIIFFGELIYLSGSSLTITEVRFLFLSSISNGIGTGMLCIVILPLFESLFGLSTPLSIAELTAIDTPLLRRLRDDAPGTYAHSMAVADLAANAANAVGANAKLTFAMALYHDIGKLYAPGYFAENIRTGVNPHDNISASESKDIIIEHVKFGYELARKTYNLSPLLYPAIQQHHGNSLLGVFYRKACKEAEAQGLPPPPPEAYRYPQQPPSSTEVAVLSLADGCEAGVRALLTQQPRISDVATKAAGKIQPNLDEARNNPGFLQETIASALSKELQLPRHEIEKAVEERINAIVMDRIKDDQLLNSTLTLKDIAAIKKSFFSTIVSQSHARPEYLR